MSTSKKPLVNAMLICDKVIAEEGTGKKSLIGIFEGIGSKAFPFTHNFLSLYIKLTDAQGSHNFSLNLVDLDDSSIIARAEMPNAVDIPSPLNFHELIFNFGGLRFKHPGKYEFQIFSNNEIFGLKTFLVDQIPKGPTTENNK